MLFPFPTPHPQQNVNNTDYIKFASRVNFGVPGTLVSLVIEF